MAKRALEPFRYPFKRHKRRFSFPARKTYRTFKPHLRDEFAKQCVYCRLPDTLKGRDSFGVDHYRPEILFPALVGVYINLFYSCPACNTRKSYFWPSDSDRPRGVFIPNPCEHTMAEHLRYHGSQVHPQSLAGLIAYDVLMFNDEESTKYRELLLRAIEYARKLVGDLQADLHGIGQALRRAAPAHRSSLLADQAQARQDLLDAAVHLDVLLGIRDPA